MRFLALVALVTISLIYADRSGLSYLGAMLTDNHKQENAIDVRKELAHAAVETTENQIEELGEIAGIRSNTHGQSAPITLDDVTAIEENLPPQGFANAKPTQTSTNQDKLAIF